MSIWEDEWEEYEMDRGDFEAWLDHINTSGDPARDEEFYNLEMEKQHQWEKQNGKYQDHEYEKYLDDNIDEMWEQEQAIMDSREYPEWMVKGPRYIMTVSNN